jgi:hypothetical protein
MIAGLVNDELAALYSYCRALAAAEPFDKAQGNLQSLLAKTGARVQPSVALFLRPLLQVCGAKLVDPPNQLVLFLYSKYTVQL